MFSNENTYIPNVSIAVYKVLSVMGGAVTTEPNELKPPHGDTLWICFDVEIKHLSGKPFVYLLGMEMVCPGGRESVLFINSAPWVQRTSASCQQCMVLVRYSSAKVIE